jgi:hypothetical protein
MVTAREFHAADGVEDWRSLYHLVSAHFRTGSLGEGIALVEGIGRVAGAAEEHLRLDLRADGVTVSLGRRDVEAARRISAVAASMGAAADPGAVQVVNVTLDALVGEAVLPFWRVVLGYGQLGDDYLFDPVRRMWLGVGGTGCISTWRCRMIWRSSGLPRRWRRVGGWCRTSTRRSGGCWLMLRATKRVSPPGWDARPDGRTLTLRV